MIIIINNGEENDNTVMKMTMAKIVMKILMTASNNDWRNVNINEIQ
jgi:hypothetical protein